MLENKFENEIQKTYEEEIGSTFIDNLTGLVNHGFFLLSLERETNRCNRHNRTLTLGLVGIDGFSAFNKKNGLIEGDRLLKNVAAEIEKCLRQEDLAARYVGDTFSIIFSEADTVDATLAAERVRAAVEKLPQHPTVSIGLAGHGPEASSSEILYLQATEALLKSKAKGKNRITLYAQPEESIPPDTPRVLIVDDVEKNLKLLEAMLIPLKYEVFKASNGQEAVDLVGKMDVDLILLDIMMPVMDGFEACRRIKSNPRTQMIPIILVTALDDMESKLKGIDVGADDFLTKPANRPELIARTKSLIKLKRLNNSLTSIENVLFALARAVEAKDAYTQGHTERVASLSLSLGKKMGLSQQEMTALSYGGIMHDIGKIGIPNDILNKPGKLDSQEWQVMQKHPDMGHKIGLPLEKNLGPALQVIRSHHEKLDGSGYPDGLKGNEISLPARIVGVVDIYDALTTDRPYRKAMPQEKAILILREEAADGKLDSAVVEQLITLIT